MDISAVSENPNEVIGGFLITADLSKIQESTREDVIPVLYSKMFRVKPQQQEIYGTH